MKLIIKKASVFFLFTFFILASCNEPYDKSLPETDVNLYIYGNTVIFPRGTKFVDVYNTTASIFIDNEWHNVSNSEWKYIKTVNTDGLINQTWEAVSFSKIRHIKEGRSGHIVYTVYLYTDDANIKEISFNWHGEWVIVDVSSSIQPIEGDITFIF